MQIIAQNGFTADQVRAQLRARDRSFSFRVELLDYAFRSVQFLDGAITGSKVEIDADRSPISAVFNCKIRIDTSGFVLTTESGIQIVTESGQPLGTGGGAGLDLFNQYLRPWVQVKMPENGDDGTPFVRYPQGIFRVTAAPKSVTPGGLIWLEIEAHDLSEMLDADQISTSFTGNAGDNIATKILELLGASPLLSYNVQDTGATLPEAKRWEPGATPLSIIDELCSLAHCYRYVDHAGVFTVRAWVDPATAAAVDTLDEADDLILVDAKESQDIFRRANRIELTSSSPARDPSESNEGSGGGSAGGVWTANVDITSLAVPISQANLLRPDGQPLVRKKVQTGVEAASPTILEDKAQEMAIEEASQPFILEGGCALRPFWGFRDVISVTRADLGYNGQKVEIRKWSFEYHSDARLAFTARRAVSLT